MVKEGVLCGRDEEFRDHVLLNCDFSKKVWKFFLSTFKRYWTLPENIREALGKDLIHGPLSTKANWIQRRQA